MFCEGRVGLVGCVKSKLGHAAPAAQLYTSALFRGRRAYVEAGCERWFVLSAPHGLVRPDVPLEPYDVALNDASRAQRRLWAAKVLRQLDEDLGPCRGLVVEIHAGANYSDWGLVAGLRQRGATVDQPASGLTLGEQLAFYARAALPESDSLSADRAIFVGGVTLTPIEPKPAPDAQGAIADLDEHPRLVRACDWPADLACLDRPGVYAWWVDDEGAADLAAGLGLALAAGRIYAGQAGATKWPSGKVGGNTLAKRIGAMHLGGKVRMSTFRWTLASILFERLNMQVRASMVITPSSEGALSEWMGQHLWVAVHPHDDRDSLDSLECRLLELFDPPLNLRHMQPTPLRERLSDLRRRISRDA